LSEAEGRTTKSATLKRRSGHKMERSELKGNGKTGRKKKGPSIRKNRNQQRSGERDQILRLICRGAAKASERKKKDTFLEDTSKEEVIEPEAGSKAGRQKLRWEESDLNRKRPNECGSEEGVHSLRFVTYYARERNARKMKRTSIIRRALGAETKLSL